MPDISCISALQLLQLADSALPVGSLAHSFGLETLIADGDVDSSVRGCAHSLSEYLEDCLLESWSVDAVFCREAYRRGGMSLPVNDLNEQLSALRMAREIREASLALGRRFAMLVSSLHPQPALVSLSQAGELHHPVAFGYAFGVLEIGSDLTVGAFLHQSILNIVSAAQRLLPLGQTQANQLSWQLKPAILEVVSRTKLASVDDVCSFAHLPETAAMRHPCLSTRLFIS